MSPIDKQNVDEKYWKPTDIKVVDEEHVENKILDRSRGFFPCDDVLVTLFVSVDCTALGEKMLYSVDVVKKLRSLKLWLGDFK